LTAGDGIWEERVMLRIRLALVALTVALSLHVASAHAAKWGMGCTEPHPKLYKVAGLARTTSIFVHVGHDVTLKLANALVKKTGGFSLDPDAITIELSFTPRDGDPIVLPPFTATAVSPDTVHFPAPDTRPLLGRLVVGPLAMVVKSGDTIIVDNPRGRYPILLPPMNDVHALTTQGSEVEVLAAADASLKRIWIPLTFGGFGPGMPMPSCPAEMSPLVAFAADFSLKKGADQIIPHLSFTSLKKTRLYLGDFNLFGDNLYGQRIKGTLNLDRTKGKAMVLCNMNDTLDLVMMLRLKTGAGREKSHIAPIVRDGSPVVLKLRNISADPDIALALSGIQKDSFGAPCELP
jgi:hypothetical protein